MSKTKTTKKRKTRLKGTDTQKPCVGCGEMKDRFKDFKPRWAGCERHRTEKGRRFYQPGCTDCDAKVNGNIRQPRCIGCDKARPKKRKKVADPTPTTVAAPTVNVDPNPTIPPAPAQEFAGKSALASVLEDTGLTVVEETIEPEAVTVESHDEPSADSEDVTPEPAPAPDRPKIASMSDLSKLFGGE